MGSSTLLVTLLALAGIQGEASGEAVAPPPPQAEEDPGWGSVTLLAGTGEALGSDDVLWMGSLGAEYFVRDRFSAAAELRGLRFDRIHGNTHGAATALLARWHPVRRTAGGVFGEAGVGGVVTGESIPLGGTSLNFSTHLGLGARVSLAGSTSLTGGIRWYHISNANLSRPNPGWDTVYGYVGLSVPVAR